jgi:transcription antitermination factor NusG
MSYWSVVYTDVASEQVARRGIEQRGFGCFLPHYRIADWCAGQPWEVRERPLFPRYVFAFLRNDPSWVTINDAHGVQGVLMSGDAPARIPSDDMAELMLAYACGTHNTISVRDAVGRFRKRKRRRRPRHGRIASGVAANCMLFPQP